jgi:hypothetical protein
LGASSLQLGVILPLLINALPLVTPWLTFGTWSSKRLAMPLIPSGWLLCQHGLQPLSFTPSTTMCSQRYLQDTHTKYLGWALADSHPDVRTSALAALTQLYKDPEKTSFMEAFTERFKVLLFGVCLTWHPSDLIWQ